MARDKRLPAQICPEHEDVILEQTYALSLAYAAGILPAEIYASQMVELLGRVVQACIDDHGASSDRVRTE